MKKISALGMLALLVFVFSPAVLAKSDTPGSGVGTPVKAMISPTSGTGVQNQNQVKTQNAGEESQLMINTAEQEEAGDSMISTGMRSEMAQEKMSEVAKGVEEILESRTFKEGIGDQVRQIAQAQKQSHEKIQEHIQKVDGRSDLMKAMIGPDYKSLKNIENLVEENQLRIEALTELKNQLVNSGDIALVQEMITALSEENVSLQDKINAENRVGSVFGWLFRLFVK